jgi:Na+/phosphate symporter
MISIWFFIGISLLVNGLLILGAGLYELRYPPEMQGQMFNLHVSVLASVWWGALMTVIGAAYCYFFKPGQKKAS